MNPLDRVAKLERALRENPDSQLCDHVADWPIEDFGRLFLTDLRAYPTLERKLPRMPAAEVQRNYNFYDGAELLKRSVQVTRYMKRHYETATARRLCDATALDYGAGWGRMARMLLQFVPADEVYACDADPASVALYNGLGFERPADAIAAVPDELPYPEGKFDLIWLYSVFTHLPDYAVDAAMRGLRRVVKPGGLMIATIRPVEFWASNPIVGSDVSVEEMVRLHEQVGLAHAPAGGGGAWGDTSMTVDYIARRWPEWRIVGAEEVEGHQTGVLLQPTA